MGTRVSSAYLRERLRYSPKGHTHPTCMQMYNMEICLGFTGFDVVQFML